MCVGCGGSSEPGAASAKPSASSPSSAKATVSAAPSATATETAAAAPPVDTAKLDAAASDLADATKSLGAHDAAKAVLAAAGPDALPALSKAVPGMMDAFEKAPANKKYDPMLALRAAIDVLSGIGKPAWPLLHQIGAMKDDAMKGFACMAINSLGDSC